MVIFSFDIIFVVMLFSFAIILFKYWPEQKHLKYIQGRSTLHLTHNVATDEYNSRNEIRHWINDKIGVAIQSWLLVRVELMTW